MKNFIILILIDILLFLTSCTQKEPLQKEAEESLYTEFRKEQSMDNKIEMFEKLKSSNPESKFVKAMLSRISYSYVKNGEYEKAENYLVENSDISTSDMYNAIAWNIYEKEENLDNATKLAQRGIDIARNELEAPKNKKPESTTEGDWKDLKKVSLAVILDTYGCIQNKLGNTVGAEKSFEEAVKLTKEEYPEINENYIAALTEQGDLTKAQLLLEKYISAGTDSKNMKSMLSDVFIKLGGKENDYEKYLSQFEQSAKQKLIAKLKSEIKNDPAPQFTLTDLDGNSVSLSDYKGKVVVVDFWATWCVPCLQSMPAMKKAIEKFSNIQFLFVNTWERVDNKKKNAIDFINENNYPFQVLLDDENEIVSKFDVQGIPTKFIIDKNQHIRFKSVGFSGKEDELIEELELMFSAIE